MRELLSCTQPKLSSRPTHLPQHHHRRPRLPFVRVSPRPPAASRRRTQQDCQCHTRRHSGLSLPKARISVFAGVPSSRPLLGAKVGSTECANGFLSRILGLSLINHLDGVPMASTPRRIISKSERLLIEPDKSTNQRPSREKHVIHIYCDPLNSSSKHT